MRDALEALLEQLLDVREVPRHSLLRELEDALLGAVDEIGDLARPLPAETRHVLPGHDQAAERRHLLDDLRVVADVRRGRHDRHQLVDALATARMLELVALLEQVDEGDRVDRLALLQKLPRSDEDRAVTRTVEVRRLQELGGRLGSLRREEHRAEDGLLRLGVVRLHQPPRADFAWVCQLGHLARLRGASRPPETSRKRSLSAQGTGGVNLARAAGERC